MKHTRQLTIEERLEKILRKAIKEIKDEIIKELFKDIIEILREMAKKLDQLAMRLDQLAERVDQLAMRLDQLAERVDQLAIQVSKLTGAVGEIRGEISEWRTIDGLKGVLKRFGLEVYASPWKPFDAYIVRDGFLAIVEICINCRERDIDQIKRGIGAAIDKLGTRPDALVVFSIMKPSETVIEYAQKLGVIVENSPIRLAKILSEIYRKKKETSEGR